MHFHATSNLKKIAHVTTLHSRDDVRIFHKEAKSLENLGFLEVFLFVYDGNNSQIVGNINVINIGKPYKNRLFRFVIGSFLTYKFCKKYNIEIIHFHDPELMLVSILLKLSGLKVIYDVHENVPLQILSKRWIKPFLRKFIGKFFSLIELISIYFFDLIIAATPSIAKRYPAHKTIIIQNFPIIDDISIKFTDKKVNTFLYVGGISMERGVVEVVDAISYIKNAKIQLVGKFDSANTFNDVSSRGGWQNVIYNHWVSRENLSSFFSKAVCGLVTFHPIPNHLNSQPNKLFEYMEAGLPVIASDFPLWRQIIDKYDCGILVNPLSSCEIFSAMQWIIDNPIEAKRMGDRGRQAVLQEFNWASESLELIKSYGKLIKKC